MVTVDVSIARVAVSAASVAIDRPFDYHIPENLLSAAVPGVRVTVPFGRGNKKIEGVILSLASSSERGELKAIERVLDEEPVLTAEQIRLALWMRDRFFCTVYDAIHAMLPTGMWFRNGERKTGDKTEKMVTLLLPAEEAWDTARQLRVRAPQQASLLEALAVTGECFAAELQYFTGASMASIRALEKKELVSIRHVEVFRRPEIGNVEPAAPIVLTQEQKIAYDGLFRLLSGGRPEAALLYGVTGSGKTSVYIQLIRDTLSMGRDAIVLVPEIALTPQLVRIFSSHFGEQVALLHSSLSAGERLDEWKRVRNGEAHVVIGTRSAVFAPVKNLGLLILDEEQEYTYKSENSPRYHAREIAKYRCVNQNALVLMGSATPSVETMYYAKSGKYHLFTLSSRYNTRPLPDVLIADMKQEIKNGNGSTISSVLYRELEENLRRGEQTILFLNRRGASSMVVCGECGHTYECPNCSVSLTSHTANHRLMCHYCGFSMPAPQYCEECGGILKYTGFGTQKVEEELKELFPDTEILRMDTDTVSAAGSHEQILSKFREKKVPILVGTQMVAKGLDFENVTLVGVISADQMLYSGDFRAGERTFGLITQVVGRSGRGQKTGRAVIQTFTPENEVIRLASRQDYDAFYEKEMILRCALSSPPILNLFQIHVSGQIESDVLRACVKLRDAFRVVFQREGVEARILGPVAAPVVRVNNRFRYRVTINAENTKWMRETITHMVRALYADKAFKDISAHADMNPYD